MEIGKLNNLKLFGSENPREKTGYPRSTKENISFYNYYTINISRVETITLIL